MKEITTQNRQLLGDAYNEYRNELLAIFHQAHISEEASEDLLHEVFMKMMRQDIIFPDMLKGLAVTIAYQKRTDYLRRQAMIHRKMDTSAYAMEYSTEGNACEVRELMALEQQVMKRLSKIECQVYSLSRFEEKTTGEIATQLNISTRSSESYLYRARKQVRDGMRRAMGM